MRFIGYIVRVLSSFFLLFATWNPLGYSYLAWIGEEDGTRLSLKAAVGVALFVVYVVYLRIAWVALGLLGTATVAATLLSGVLMMRHLGLFDDDAPFWSSYLMLVLASAVLATGLCWAHFKRRVTGQSHVLYPPP